MIDFLLPQWKIKVGSRPRFVHLPAAEQCAKAAATFSNGDF
ncbi:MAG TPA: hypothetical protein VNA29_00420 [Sphingomicrobium sp.]|nr:hypothetical protein [Sphingomicrobium sp.]